MKDYRLVLDSRRSEVSKVEDLLVKVNESFGLEPEKFINFQIAVSEAVVNAIVHGNEERDNKKVYIIIEEYEDKIILKIKDEGKGFDVSLVPDPTKDENILKEHGRGVYIIRSLVDEVECYSSDKGTELVLKMRK